MRRAEIDLAYCRITAPISGRTGAVLVQLDPLQLASRGLGVDEVARAVSSANVNLPTGTLHGPSTATTVQATGQLPSASSCSSVS